MAQNLNIETLCNSSKRCILKMLSNILLLILFTPGYSAFPAVAALSHSPAKRSAASISVLLTDKSTCTLATVISAQNSCFKSSGSSPPTADLIPI
jgi:hypothetical protein